MSRDADSTPRQFADLALVLSGGGARACYQVGVLAHIVERVPGFRVPILTGVSAGAINAVSLAAYPGRFDGAVRTLCRKWKQLTPDRVYHTGVTSVLRASARWIVQTILRRGAGPGVLQGMMDLGPLRTFLDQAIDFTVIEDNIRKKKLDVLALSATSYTYGRTVTFIHGCEDVPMWERVMRVAVRSQITLDHVIASASIPIVFPAVKLSDGFYGDGSVRQTAPLAPAIHMGARRIIAVSMRTQRGPVAPAVPVGDYPTVAEVMALLFNAIFLDALDADAERLHRINQLLETVPGDGPSQGLRPVELLLLRPSRDLGALAKGHVTELPPLVRFVVQGLGGRRRRASDLLSYLLFEPRYTEKLMELGYTDAETQWERIEKFLAAAE